MGWESLIGAGTNLIGGWLARNQANRQQNQADQYRKQALGYMQGADAYDPMSTPQGQAMQGTADQTLGDYRNNAMASMNGQYGQRGLMGSSMATSSMGPGLEDAFHRQRLDSQNQIGDYIQRMRAAKFGEAGQMAGVLTGQAGVYDQRAAQSGQEAMQGFQGAGNMIGNYLADREKQAWFDSPEGQAFLKQYPQYAIYRHL